MMRTNNGLGAARWALLYTLLTLVLGGAGPWATAQAAPTWRSQTTGTVNATSITLANPADTVQNDLLLAVISTRGGTVTPNTPNVWTLINQQTQGGETLAVYYLRYNATTPASHRFNFSSSSRAAGAILRYTGVDGLQAIDISGVAAGSSTNATAPTVTTNVGDTTVVRIAGIGGGNYSVTSPATERFDIEIGNDDNGTTLAVSDATQALAGSTNTADFTWTGSEDWVAATVVLRPFTSTLCANPPSSGTTTLTAGTYNRYYPGTATAAAGSVSITLGTSTGAGASIAAGDLLLVIQMQDAAINTSNDERYGDGTGTAGNTTGNGSGATNYNSAGLYEFVVAKSAVGTGGGTVQIEGKGVGGGLINTYTNAPASNAKGQSRFQVVRVPQYYDAIVTGAVTAAAWNGTSGGIVALDVANTLTFSGGSINVNALGFRGGLGQQLTGGTGVNTDYVNLRTRDNDGNKGEGVAGSPLNMYNGTGATTTGGGGYPTGSASTGDRARGAPGNAGGGGTDGTPSDNAQNSGGGGGGNGGAGGLGGFCWNSANCSGRGFGGAAFPHTAGRLAMGGGGGSGSRNNNDTNYTCYNALGSSGGVGGGAILIRANTISGSATLNAKGGDGVLACRDGGGGGGAGGSVLVFARTADGLNTLTINAKGGKGADAWPDQAPGGTPGERHGPGGGGAGGVIYLSSNIADPTTTTTIDTGGDNGTTTTAADAYGATVGGKGFVNNALTEDQIPGVTSGATCKATLASVAAFGATVESGRVALFWETSSELGTAGFHVERLDPVSGDYVRLNDALLPALITSPQGGRYTFMDPDAWPDRRYTYRLVEQEVWGNSMRIHGPYPVTPSTKAKMATAQTALADDADGTYSDPAQGYQAVPHALGSRNVMRTIQAASPMASKNKATGMAQIPVRQNGLYSASVAQIAQAMGSAEDDVRKSLRNRKLELTVAGKDVAWLPAANDAGILFYGEAIDSLYTLDNIYRLRSNQKGAVMEESPAKQKAPDPVAAGDFADTVIAEQDKLAATVVSTCTECDYWYWEGFIGGNDPKWNAKEVTVQLPNVTGDGTLSVFLKGAASGSHPVQVSVNGQSLGQGTWNDLADYELRLPVTSAQLQSGDNLVKVSALGGSDNMFYLDRIEVNYRRLARAVSDRLILKAERDGPLAVDGFSASDINVFDISDPRKPVHVTGATVTSGATDQSVTFNAEEGRRYLTLANKAIISAAPISMTAADLQTTRDRVSYLVIAPPALRDAAQTLADYRQGRGLNSRVVGTDEIYDSYNWGIASPYAVRDFLRQVVSAWGVRYGVLVGIGTLDYRDLMGLGEPQAPTLMTSTPNGLYGCDNCLADFDGDGAPDLAISRIPAASVADVQTYLAKVKAYEQRTVSLPQAGVLLLADKLDPKAGNFAQDSDSLVTLLPSGTSIGRIYLDQYDISAARSLLFPILNRGVGWVNYIGHGGMDRLSASGLLTVNDMSTLASAGPLPVISGPTCLINRFETPGYASLGERLVLDVDGGAIAVWSATGLSLNSQAVLIDQSLFAAVFQQRMPTLGEAVQQALQNNRQRQDVPAYTLRIYNLLGDAALELRR